MDHIKNKKISNIFYMEIAYLLHKEEFNNDHGKFLITLIKVSMTPDRSLIKSYIAIYPFLDKSILKKIRSKSRLYRKYLSKKLRYRVKKIPKLYFHVDN